MMGGPVIFRVTFLFAVLSVFHGSAGSIAFFRMDLTSKSSQVPPFVQMILLPITVGSTSNSITVEFQLSRIITPSVLAAQGFTDKGYDGSPPVTKSYVPSTKEITPSLGDHGESQTRNGPSLRKDHGGTFSNLIPPIAHSRRMSEAMAYRKVPKSNAPITMPLTPAPFSSLQRELPLKPPVMHPSMVEIAPSFTSAAQYPAVSPRLLSSHGKQYGMPVAAPPKEIFNHLSPMKRSPHKGSFPDISPSPHEATKPPANESVPIISSPKLPTRKRVHGPAFAPSISFHKHHPRKVVNNPASVPSHLFSPPTYHQGPVIPPAPSHSPVVPPKRNKLWKHTPPPSNQVLSPSPFSSTVNQGTAPAPSPSLTAPSSLIKKPIYSPAISPSSSLPKKPRMPVPTPVQALPPPPPNQDCTSLTCTEPLTNTPPGSPCACVWPMKVGLRLSVALYTFFPLVSELAKEIASGILMKQSQVRIMGANAASLQPEKTVVLIDLVPLGEKFDNTTAFLTYERFWYKQVVIKSNLFGDYEVLYVRFPGLPPSPPLAPSNITIEDEPLANDNNGRAIKPIGVDVTKRKHRLGRSLIAIIALSSAIALVVCVGAIWFLLLKRRDHARQLEPASRSLVPPFMKPSAIVGAGSMNLGSGPSSASMSLSSSIATYTGSAKTFSFSEIEKATDNFKFSRILGEGGFGLVYSGILDDGIKVAVKVLKRDDHQGGREFLAEVEMLSRLHHRNLVKLIGICTEEHSRCLVYELIPNGSVESHLHGVDKETAPLDWGARMKIALGSARGLAYLHEDSSPRVIHRDFKSSNILLEYDFTPKVSDFGLAKTALDEGSEHISTRVMGTFGYVAPEYAMTGHLLVKSDVYSYGVVLLELLTGRKPVDMSQPPGQENLVNWARPLLTSKEGLEIIIDPALGSSIPFDSVAKVAAIASMCVQPEVSHRPFMGEVVQALKLVCNECDEKKGGSGSFSQEDMEMRMGTFSGQLPETRSYVPADYESGLEADRALSASDIFSTSARYGRQESGSFRRHSSSGPLISGRNWHFWQRVKGLSRGSVSEHGVALKSWVGLEGGGHWP